MSPRIKGKWHTVIFVTKKGYSNRKPVACNCSVGEDHQQVVRR